MVIPFPVQRPQPRAAIHPGAVDALLRWLYECGEDDDLQAAADRMSACEQAVDVTGRTAVTWLRAPA